MNRGAGKGAKRETWRTWHSANLDRCGGVVPVRNDEGMAWECDGEIWQAGEVKRMPIDRAFELYAFEGRLVHVDHAHRYDDPMIAEALKQENVWITVTDDNIGLPSVARAAAEHGKDRDGRTHRGRLYYIEDDPRHVTADVIRQHADYMSGRVYGEGVGVPMYPEEFERSALLGVAVERAERMRALRTFYARLPWATPAGKSWLFSKLEGQYFLAPPDVAAELEADGEAERVSDDEWIASRPGPLRVEY